MVNKVFLVGHLGDAPVPHTFADGGMLATASLATNEHWRDARTGDRVERTEWHRLVFRARTAEVAAQYLRKGAKIFVEGQLRTRKWQAEDGADRYVTEVHVRQMQMLDRKFDNQPRAPSSSRNAYADAKEGRLPVPAPSADAGAGAMNRSTSPLRGSDAKQCFASPTTPAPDANVGVVPLMPEFCDQTAGLDDIPF